MCTIRSIKNNECWHGTFYRSEGSELVGFIATHIASRHIYVTNGFHTKSSVVIKITQNYYAWPPCCYVLFSLIKVEVLHDLLMQ